MTTTTTNGTDIVPAMHSTGVSLWTPGGPHIIHTEGDTTGGGTHTLAPATPDPSPIGTVGTHTPGHTEPGGPHTPPTADIVGTHTPGHTEPGDTPTDQAVSIGGTAVGTHMGTHDGPHTDHGTDTMGTAVGTHMGTHDGPHTDHGTDTMGTAVGTPDDEPGDNIPMHISEAQRAEVSALPHKSDQIRHICALLGNYPEPAEVHAWLEACGTRATRKYVSKIVNEYRDENGLTDTGEFPTLTDEDLAELDAQTGADQTDQGTAALPAESDEAAPELAALVRQANARLPLQSDPALTEVLSDDELAKVRKLAELRRATRREIEERELAAELARAKRMQANEEAIAKAEASDARWLQRARSKRHRLASPDAKLAQTVRNSEWSSRALIAAVAGGMIWSAFNAQQNLVPDGNMANPLYWLSFFVEAMISLPLIVIMVASATATRLGHKSSTEEKRKIIAVELVLLAMTLMLNVGKHLFPPEGVDIVWMDVFKFGVAPVMVGVLLQVHAQVSDHYAGLILGADQAPSGPQNDQQTTEGTPAPTSMIGAQQ